MAILWVPTFELVCSSSSGLTFTCAYMSCVRGAVCIEGAVWRELFGGTVAGAVWGYCVGSCMESCMGSCVWGICTSHQMVQAYTHLAPSTLSTRGIPHYPLTNCPPSSSCTPVPTHSSSQVVHCRVCPPHPLHAPLLVLHLAVYPASPTQGRVGLTDRLTHSAQTQCILIR